MASDRPNYAPEIRAALSDPTAVLDALGILGEGGARKKQAAGWIIRCPVHPDSKPSCSVQSRPEGLLWKCHSCQASGDAISLVAAVRGTSLRGSGFKETLIECARLAGLWGIVAELEGRAKPNETPRPAIAPAAPPEPPRDYPPIGEVMALWNSCEPTTDDQRVSDYLRDRSIDPDRVDAAGLARIMSRSTKLPAWARCRGGDWREAGYRLIVPMYAANGAIRSVRGWRIDGDPELPKRLPPSGHKASGIVLADEMGRAMLTGARAPARVVVVEGEPDFLTWASRLNDPNIATIGIMSGAWSAELAQRFPIGCRVDIRTDHDQAGDRYAAEVVEGLKRRCFTFRSKEA